MKKLKYGRVITGRGDVAKNQRATILAKTNGHCAYCGVQLTGRWQIDHVIPRWHVDQYRHRYPTDFDVNHPDNLMPSCCSCNNYKSGNPLEVFRSMIGKQIEVLRRDRPTFRLAERYGLISCEPKEIVFYFETYRPKIQCHFEDEDQRHNCLAICDCHLTGVRKIVSKPFKVANVRPLVNQMLAEEISFSRFVEILNEIANDKHIHS